MSYYANKCQRYYHTTSDSAGIYHHISELAGAPRDEALVDLVGHGITKAEDNNAQTFQRKEPALSHGERRAEAKRRINGEMCDLPHYEFSLFP